MLETTPFVCGNLFLPAFFGYSQCSLSSKKKKLVFDRTERKTKMYQSAGSQANGIYFVPTHFLFRGEIIFF